MSRYSLISLLFLTFAGCATSRQEVVPLGKTLPSEDFQQEETELREIVLQFQRDLEEKHAFYPDEVLENYLKEVAAPFLQDLPTGQETKFRFGVLRDPTVNAASLMTGLIYFHSGILARLENEAQLAFVLAHEISHVYHRDLLYSHQNLKRKTVTFKVMDLLLTPAASFVGAGDLSEAALGVIYLSSVTGYGRMEETEADRFALERVIKAGYDPHEAVQFFDILLAEREWYQKGVEIFFLSSHPSNQGRKAWVKRWLETHRDEIGKISEKRPIRIEKEKFLEKTYGVRRENAKLNADLGRFFHALGDIDKVLKQNPDDPVAYYYRGEIYRQMPEKRLKLEEELSGSKWSKIKSKDSAKQNEEWQNLATASYLKAMELDPAYAPPYKGLAICYLELKEFQKARVFFKKYLELAPEAKDRRSVVRYLTDMDELMARKTGS